MAPGAKEEKKKKETLFLSFFLEVSACFHTFPVVRLVEWITSRTSADTVYLILIIIDWVTTPIIVRVA